ncbi:MAG: FG-GAP repeat domain-containing protein [Phycisphaerae bacterium]
MMVALAGLLGAESSILAADCNDNGIDDATEILSGMASDCNSNGIPDDCDLTPALSFGAPMSNPVGAAPVILVAGDLDGAPGLDLVTANSGDRNVSVLLNNGNGTLATAVPYATDREVFSVALADFDGILGMDIAAATKNDTVTILLNNGDGTFVDGGTLLTLGDRPLSIAAGDLDGVNGPDLAVTSRNVNPMGVFIVSVLMNNGDGTFAGAVTYAVQDTPRHVVMEDLDGINGLDLAVANKQSDTVSILLNNGDGTFAPAVNVAAGNGPVSIAPGDFDGDLDLDFAVANTGSNSVRVLLNDGSGAFSFGGQLLVGVGPESVAAKDFDGDGHLDLVVANRGTVLVPGTTVSVLLNRGDGTFRGHVEFPTGISPISVVSEDFDQNGLPDIATAHDLTPGNVSVLFMGPIVQFSQDCNTNGVPDECDIALGTGGGPFRGASRAAAAGAGGIVFLSGDDADDVGHCQGTACGGLYPAIFSFGVANSASPGTGILAIGVNAGSAQMALDSWNDPLNGGPGAPVTVLTTPAEIAAVNFLDFSLLYIPSIALHTVGGITSVQLDALNARQGDVVNFVNVSGGALVALTEANVPNAYGWIPFPIETADQVHTNVCPTAALTGALAPMATCANMSHGVYHTIFTGPPGFLGMEALALSADAPVDQVVLLGGINVIIGGQISLTPDTAAGPMCQSHVLTATVTQLSFPFDPLQGALVTFDVISGPNLGMGGTGVTDVLGVATFSYRGEGGPGLDGIQASFVDQAGLHQSNVVTTTWIRTSEDCNTNGVPDECELLAPGDLDGNGVINSADYPLFNSCLTGPGAGPASVPPLYACIPCCQRADLDLDGDADMEDYALFEAILAPGP